MYKRLIPVLLLGLQLTTIAQSQRKAPKNFAGPLLFFDITNVSGSLGLSYERQLFAGNHFLFSARVDQIKKYKTGNADISISGYSSGFNGNYSISLTQLWGMGYLFFSQGNNYSGLFVSTAFGLTNSVAKKIEKNNYGKDRYNDLLGGIELGSGLRFPISNKADFRGMLTLSFSDHQDNPGDNRSSLVLLGARMSIGF